MKGKVKQLEKGDAPGHPCHPPTPYSRNRSEVPNASHLTVIQRGFRTGLAQSAAL